MHRCTFVAAFDIVALDLDVIIQPALRSQHLRDRLAEQAVVMLLQPLVVEAARKLNGQLMAAVIFRAKVYSPEGFEPRPKPLLADIVPDDVETPFPGCFR